MVMLGVIRHHLLSLLPALPLLPRPALGQQVPPPHPGLDLSLKFVISLDQPSNMWTHSVAMDEGWECPPSPLSHRCSCMGQGEWQPLQDIPWSSQSYSGPLPMPWPTQKTNRSPLTCRGVQISLCSFQCTEGCLQACNFYSCFILL